MCVNHPKIAEPFRFVWFEEFAWVCYSPWEDRTYCLPFVLFGYKNVGKSLPKTILNMEKKHQNVPMGTHKKRQILFHRFLGRYTLSLCPPLFVQGGE